MSKDRTDNTAFRFREVLFIAVYEIKNKGKNRKTENNKNVVE